MGSWLTGMLCWTPEGQVCNRPFHTRINRQGTQAALYTSIPSLSVSRARTSCFSSLSLLGLGLFCAEERKHGQSPRSNGIRPHFKFMLLRFASGLICLLFSIHVLWYSLHGYYWPWSFFFLCLFGFFFNKAAVLCFDLQVRELKCYTDVLSDLHKAMGCITCAELTLALWISSCLKIILGACCQLINCLGLGIVLELSSPAFTENELLPGVKGLDLRHWIGLFSFACFEISFAIVKPVE